MAITGRPYSIFGIKLHVHEHDISIDKHMNAGLQ
jgi:hypothetical protein